MTLRIAQILRIWPLSIFSVVFVPSIFFVWLPHKIFSSFQGWFSGYLNLGVFRFFGLLPIALGFGVFIWCVLSFAILGKGTPSPIVPPQNLVVRGLYRHVRNPMYIGWQLVLTGETIWFQCKHAKG